MYYTYCTWRRNITKPTNNQKVGSTKNVLLCPIGHINWSKSQGYQSLSKNITSRPTKNSRGILTSMIMCVVCSARWHASVVYGSIPIVLYFSSSPLNSWFFFFLFLTSPSGSIPTFLEVFSRLVFQSF